MIIRFENTIIGRVGIAADSDRLIALLLPGAPPPTAAHPGDSPLLREAFRQLDGYLLSELHDFSLPLEPRGTPFRLRVWDELLRIPRGEVRSYGEIATAIGAPRAARAVGGACHANPLPIFIPCHRVVGADGALTGFGGGLELKRFLLDLETGHHQ